MHRELRVVDAAAFSVGLIGPVGAIALLGTGAAGIIGRGVTLSFIFAVIGVALVAYAFVRLSQHISHSGSVYALVGVTLGPRWPDSSRAGRCSGPTPRSAAARRSRSACSAASSSRTPGSPRSASTSGSRSSAWHRLRARVQRDPRHHPHAAGVRARGRRPGDGPQRRHPRGLIFGHGPQGQTFNGHFLTLPSGADIGVVASAAVYGFLAFAGFEGAAAWARRPTTRDARSARDQVAVSSWARSTC